MGSHLTKPFLPPLSASCSSQASPSMALTLQGRRRELSQSLSSSVTFHKRIRIPKHPRQPTGLLGRETEETGAVGAEVQEDSLSTCVGLSVAGAT